MKIFSHLVMLVMIIGIVSTSCNNNDDNSHEYHVTFNSNGGSKVTPQIVRKGEKATKPDDPTYDGHTFIAWYKEEELTNEWKFEEDVVTANITLYAKWRSSFSFISGITIDNYPKMDGSTSTEPLNTIIACKLLGFDYEWIPAFHQQTRGVNPFYDQFWRLPVRASQTSQAFINLVDKKADLILSARKMSSDEKDYAHAAEVSLIETPIALDAFIFIVHPDNPIKSLTKKQIQDIYTGKITNWKEVGERDEKIRPYVRNRNSGSQELMESLVMKDLEIMEFPESVYEQYNPTLLTMWEPIEEVSREFNAICYTVYYYNEQIVVGTKVKTIAVDGIYPDTETISKYLYPYVAEVYAVIRTDLDHSSMAYKVYEWLQTEAGKGVIKESGYIPN